MHLKVPINDAATIFDDVDCQCVTFTHTGSRLCTMHVHVLHIHIHIHTHKHTQTLPGLCRRYLCASASMPLRLSTRSLPDEVDA